MSLVIDDPEVEEMIQRAAEANQQSATEIMRRILKPLYGVAPLEVQERRRAAIEEAQAAIAALPVLDTRSADEIIGYNEHGHFD